MFGPIIATETFTLLTPTSVAAMISAAAAIFVAYLNYRLTTRLDRERAQTQQVETADTRRLVGLEKAQAALRRIINDGWIAYEELRDLAAVAPMCDEDDQFVLRAAEALAKLGPFIDSLQQVRRNGALFVLHNLPFDDNAESPKAPDIPKLMQHVSKLFLLQSAEKEKRRDRLRIDRIQQQLDRMRAYLAWMNEYTNGLLRSRTIAK